MKLETFALERFQSIWENRVAWNVSESGVHPLRVSELVNTPAHHDALLEQELGYPQTNGTVELREAIAGDVSRRDAGPHPGHQRRLRGQLRPADAPGRARRRHRVHDAELHAGLGPRARARRDRPPVAAARTAPERSGRADLDELQRARHARRPARSCSATPTTRPARGSTRRRSTRSAASRPRSAPGSWTTRSTAARSARRTTRRRCGGATSARSSRAACRRPTACPDCGSAGSSRRRTSSSDLWAIHDYTTIAPGGINDRLARIALAPARRAELLARTRGIIRANYPLVRRLDRAAEGLSHIAPEAGAIAFVRYTHPIRSSELTERLREERSVLVVPGDHFDMDGYLRIGFGSDPAYLDSALVADRRVPERPPACMRADLALVGFGHVGRRFARLLEERRDWLALDYDLDCRVVGIATRHHGARVPRRGRRRGGDARSSIEGGHPMVEDGTSQAADSFDVIRRLADGDAPLKVLIETHDARHHRRPAGDRPRARRAAGRLPRRDREQGAGGVRVRGAERRRRAIADGRSCSRGR